MGRCPMLVWQRAVGALKWDAKPMLEGAALSRQTTRGQSHCQAPVSKSVLNETV